MTIPLKKFSPYFIENLSVDRCENQLQISSTCNADCIFCSNKQNPFKIERFGFRPLEEIKKIIWATDYIYDSIILNESLPGRISEGEAVLHPQFFEILDIIRSKFDNIISFSTNGSLLSEKFIENLSKYLPVEVIISIPSINKKYWMESFNLKEEHYKNAINSFSLLMKAGVKVIPSIVPMPSWIGYDEIEKVIKFLSKMEIKEIFIYAPGYTRYTKKNVVPKLLHNRIELSKYLQKCSDKYNISFDWALDPYKELPIDEDYIHYLIVEKLLNKGINESYWFTSTSAYEKFARIIKDTEDKLSIPVIFYVVPIENIAYGGNIECTGLWMISDIKIKIEKLKLENKTIVLPNNFIDKYGYDLCGENIVDYVNRSNNNFMFLGRDDYMK